MWELKTRLKLCVTSQNSHTVVAAWSAATGASLCQVLRQGPLQVPLQGGSLAEIFGGHQFIQRLCLVGNECFILLSLTGTNAVWYLLLSVAQRVIDHGAAVCLRLPVELRLWQLCLRTFQ